MDQDLLIAYRAGIAKGYPPRDLVLLAVHLDAPNATHYCPSLPANGPRLPWCFGARTKSEAFALLSDADRARASEAYAGMRLEDVFVIHVVEDGHLRFAPERRPQR
jgi:hypothetical protein